MNKQLAVNFIGFQLGWFACVLLAATHQPMVGSAVGLLLVILHLYLSNRPGLEIKMILLVALVGGLWDSLLTFSGVLQFSSGLLSPWIAPHWILVMWLLFASTLNCSLRWLQGRYLLAMPLGAVAGPLAYHGGAALGAVSIADPVLGTGLLAAGWALLLPLLLYIAEAFKQSGTTEEYA